MPYRIRAAVSATVLVVTPLAVATTTTTAAHAAGTKYSNCTALARDFPHGVAKSAAAANKQVRAGYGRPATSKRAKAVYKANFRSLDRDKDGTACER